MRQCIQKWKCNVVHMYDAQHNKPVLPQNKNRFFNQEGGKKLPPCLCVGAGSIQISPGKLPSLQTNTSHQVQLNEDKTPGISLKQLYFQQYPPRRPVSLDTDGTLVQSVLCSGDKAVYALRGWNLRDISSRCEDPGSTDNLLTSN